MSGGQWIQQVTLGWLLYDLTGSSVLLGLLNGLRALPFLIASPIAGVAADRMDRKQLILATQYVLIMTTLTMGLLVASGILEVWHLFVFTVVTGVIWAFVDPVRQTLVPALVPREDLMNAVALNSAAFNLTKVIGPSLGGVLILFSGAAGNFFVQSAAYIGVLASIYWMSIPPTPTEARQSSAIANLKEGLVYVWSNPSVFALMATALVPRIFAVPYQTLMPVFQKDVLKVGPEGLGVLLAAPGRGRNVGRAHASDISQSRQTARCFDAGELSFPRGCLEPILVDDFVPHGHSGVDCYGWLPSLLHGHDQYDAPSDCSGPSAWTGNEHLCVGPRIDAARSAHGGSQRPRYRRSRDRELHGIGGYTAGNSGGLARGCGSGNRFGGGGLSCLSR